ncbi:serine/arginine repetitive matrix protein 1 [Hyalella azteca]|uniref:Serine/arginine repetitive matrix protein 1 n=1 Tax=Hyalella azteca TaxID=294128 RepID=A0A8B7NCZ6_HYAAZ|nr:serine/arginine repetitive matrix protein 1 [Hyalella azteca]
MKVLRLFCLTVLVCTASSSMSDEEMANRILQRARRSLKAEGRSLIDSFQRALYALQQGSTQIGSDFLNNLLFTLDFMTPSFGYVMTSIYGKGYRLNPKFKKFLQMYMNEEQIADHNHLMRVFEETYHGDYDLYLKSGKNVAGNYKNSQPIDEATMDYLGRAIKSNFPPGEEYSTPQLLGGVFSVLQGLGSQPLAAKPSPQPPQPQLPPQPPQPQLPPQPPLQLPPQPTRPQLQLLPQRPIQPQILQPQQPKLQLPPPPPPRLPQQQVFEAPATGYSGPTTSSEQKVLFDADGNVYLRPIPSQLAPSVGDPRASSKPSPQLTAPQIQPPQAPVAGLNQAHSTAPIEPRQSFEKLGQAAPPQLNHAQNQLPIPPNVQSYVLTEKVPGLNLEPLPLEPHSQFSNEPLSEGRNSDPLKSSENRVRPPTILDIAENDPSGNGLPDRSSRIGADEKRQASINDFFESLSLQNPSLSTDADVFDLNEASATKAGDESSVPKLRQKRFAKLHESEKSKITACPPANAKLILCAGDALVDNIFINPVTYVMSWFV